MLFYSDGLGEARLDEEQLFETERLRADWMATKNVSLKQSLQALLAAARQFQNRESFEDDVTIVTVEVPGGQSQGAAGSA